MNKEYYKIKTSHATYFVEVWHKGRPYANKVEHQYPNVDKVFIGGKQKCVSFSVYLEDIESPNLDGFGYSEHCNKAGNHIKGVGSIHLLNVSIQFILAHYNLPRDTQFQFKDTSFIECNAYKLSLPVYYIVFHGKTWYESKFNAIPLYISQEELKEQRKKLKDYLKTKPPIEEWFTGKEKLKAMIGKIYNKTGSIQECLDELKELDCSIFKNWLPALVLKYVPVLLGTEWSIQCHSDVKMKIQKLLEKPDKLFKMEGGNMELLFKTDEL